MCLLYFTDVLHTGGVENIWVHGFYFLFFGPVVGLVWLLGCAPNWIIPSGVARARILARDLDLELYVYLHPDHDYDHIELEGQSGYM